MTARNKGLWMLGVTFVLTVLVVVLKELDRWGYFVMWSHWAFCGWNYFAYGFSRDMWPWSWVELKGEGGSDGERTFMFWGTALINLSYLALHVFYAPWAKFIA